MYAKLVFLNIFLICVITANISAQSPCDGIQMPPGTLCITQAAGNQAAQLAREAPLKDEKIKVLTDALTEKDKIIADNKAVAAKNEADLKEALTRTQTELAMKTGQLIGSEASNVRNLALIDVLLKSTKKQCKPFSICVF